MSNYFNSFIIENKIIDELSIRSIKKIKR